MSKRIILPVMLLLFAGNSIVVHAQQERRTDVRSELSFAWAFPQGAFGSNIDNPFPGVLFSFGGLTPDLPIVLTTEIGWLNYGFENYLKVRYDNTPTSGVSVVNIQMANDILMTHLAARYIPFEGEISPYVDVLLGFKYLSSNVFIESEAIVDDDDLIAIVDGGQILTSSNFSSFTLSYGIGAGVDIVVYEGLESGGTVSLNLGVRYLFGSEADYLAESSISPSSNGILFEQLETDTDMLIPKFGLRFGL